jgi:hypothetical protein
MKAAIHNQIARRAPDDADALTDLVATIVRGLLAEAYIGMDRSRLQFGWPCSADCLDACPLNRRDAPRYQFRFGRLDLVPKKSDRPSNFRAG